MVEYERNPVPGGGMNGGTGGVIAVLVVIVVLLVAGFLYFTRYGDVDDRPDIELNVPAPDAPDVDIDVPDVDVNPPRGQTSP
jgi:hypothetical protein